MITISNADCLKAVVAAHSEGEPLVPSILAHWLSAKPPAVTAALRRLQRDGLVRMTKSGRVALTGEGRRIARRTLFRHHLIERMLSEMFEMPWHEVHAEAERLEQAVSPALEKRLIEKLGRNGRCPYGNGSTMESPATRRKNGLLPMSEAEEDTNYVIARVPERDRRLLQFFDQEGIRPGTEVTVKTRHYDRTTTVTFRDRSLRIGLAATTKIWVRKM